MQRKCVWACACAAAPRHMLCTHAASARKFTHTLCLLTLPPKPTVLSTASHNIKSSLLNVLTHLNFSSLMLLSGHCVHPSLPPPLCCHTPPPQAGLTHLNLDSRGVSDACLPLLLPLGPSLRELDLSGGRITSRGCGLLASCFRELEVLDLCGGHITGACRQRDADTHFFLVLNVSHEHKQVPQPGRTQMHPCIQACMLQSIRKLSPVGNDGGATACIALVRS
jgi:hypothetical protein